MDAHSGAGAAEVDPIAVGEEMLARDRASRQLGMRLEATDVGRATVTMTVQEDMVNGHGMCHGGLIFSLADTALAVASNSANEVTVAAGAAIEFVEPATVGMQLVATGRLVSMRGRTGHYDIEVRTGDGQLIALFRGRTHRVGGTVI